MQTYTHHVAFLGGIFIAVVVVVAALVPVLQPLVRSALRRPAPGPYLTSAAYPGDPIGPSGPVGRSKCSHSPAIRTALPATLSGST